MKKKFSPQFIVVLLTIFFVEDLYADYYGRFISGAFVSKEIFRSALADRYNDVAILSERFYVNFDKLLDTNSELTVDVRDKENFFDKLNTETLKLTAKNKLQLHQMNFHKSNVGEGVDFSVGRFPIAEAGAIYLDGIDFGFRKNISGMLTKFSLFYGLNPQLVEDAQININQNLKAYGAYAIIENKSKDSDSFFLSTSSLVRQIYKSEIDRFYYFNSTNIQSSNKQNFSSILYLDLKPIITIQNLWTTYVFSLQNQYRLRTSLSTIDSLNYFRLQDLRETLPSSRYSQLSFSVRSPSAYNETTYETKLLCGLRAIDKKTLSELKFATFIPRIFSDEISGNISTGIRKNFVSNDLLLGFGGLHSNKNREISLNQNFELEKRRYEKLNMVYITDASYTKFLSRGLFGIFSLQNTWDNNVSIFSMFFKIAYRFGEGGQAPIRDGSPPMGQL